MDRSRREGRGGSEPAVPTSSRLTLRGRKNRRRPQSVWSRVPRPPQIADACKRTLRRSLPALAVTAAIATLGGGLWLGHRFVTTSDRFAITTIEIRGAEQLSPDAIRAALPVAPGANIFTTNLDAVGNALRAHPWIDSATAHRVLPHTLVVEVREHRAVALAQLDHLYLVDESGHAFKRADLDAGEGAGLPIITGIDRAAYQRDPRGTATTILAALDVLARWNATGARPAIGELHVDALGALTLRTYEHGAAIQLGALQLDLRAGSPTPGRSEAGYTPASVIDARLRAFDAAWAELADAERVAVRTLHLDTRPDHVTVAFAKD